MMVHFIGGAGSVKSTLIKQLRTQRLFITTETVSKQKRKFWFLAFSSQISKRHAGVVDRW